MHSPTPVPAAGSSVPRPLGAECLEGMRGVSRGGEAPDAQVSACCRPSSSLPLGARLPHPPPPVTLCEHL